MAARRQWQAWQPLRDMHQYVFLDECGVTTDLLRRYGRSPLGVPAEVEDTYTHLRFSQHGTAFLTDAIIMQRYMVLKGQLQRIMAVVKVRGSAHSKDLRTYEITEDGIVMGHMLGDYEGLLTGEPELIRSLPPKAARKSPRRRVPPRARR